jgi:hypothetical protein
MSTPAIHHADRLKYFDNVSVKFRKAIFNVLRLLRLFSSRVRGAWTRQVKAPVHSVCSLCRLESVRDTCHSSPQYNAKSRAKLDFDRRFRQILVRLPACKYRLLHQPDR